MAKTPKTKKKTALQKHMSEIGKKGGAATLKKHGREHFRKASQARWEDEM